MWNVAYSHWPTVHDFCPCVDFKAEKNWNKISEKWQKFIFNLFNMHLSGSRITASRTLNQSMDIHLFYYCVSYVHSLQFERNIFAPKANVLRSQYGIHTASLVETHIVDTTTTQLNFCGCMVCIQYARVRVRPFVCSFTHSIQQPLRMQTTCSMCAWESLMHFVCFVLLWSQWVDSDCASCARDICSA